MRKRCPRCGKRFVPQKRNYRYCPQCYPDIAPMGRTTARRRPKGAARRHGGVSRTTDDLRPVTLRGDITSKEIVRGMHDFLTALYRQPTRISTILRNAGLDAAEIANLREQRWLNDYVLRFCPRLWEWLGTTVGSKAREIVIDSYGLYGGQRRSVPSIGRELGITADHAKDLRGWALKKIRTPKNRTALEGMMVLTARNVLERRQKKIAGKGDNRSR